MNEPIVVSKTLTPIKLATEDLSENMKCVISSFSRNSDEDFALIYWKMVNISKHKSNNNKWYLKDTICHGKIQYLQNVSNRTQFRCK